MHLSIHGESIFNTKEGKNSSSSSSTRTHCLGKSELRKIIRPNLVTVWWKWKCNVLCSVHFISLDEFFCCSFPCTLYYQLSSSSCMYVTHESASGMNCKHTHRKSERITNTTKPAFYNHKAWFQTKWLCISNKCK